jgi:hypothetical protein
MVFSSHESRASGGQANNLGCQDLNKEDGNGMGLVEWLLMLH